MADLILNNPGLGNSSLSGNESDYEFDPNDSDAIERIHVLLSLRKNHHIQNSEKLLAIVCNKTIDHQPKPQSPIQ
jgi:hypothetical protein